MKKVYLLFVVLTTILSGCAMHNGYINNSVALSSNNYIIKGQASGAATATYIFGLGGLDRTAMVAEAKKDMMYNFPLREGEAYANTSVVWKNSFIFFVKTSKVTISADIIKFTK